MYFPYLRGKRFEFITLKNTAENTLTSGKIIPIIEPVKEKSSDFNLAFEVLAFYEIQFIILINPTVGELENSPSRVKQLLITNIINAYEHCIIGLNITNKTTEQELNELFEDYEDYDIALIHQFNSNLDGIVNIRSDSHERDVYNIFVEGPTSFSYRDKFNSTFKVLLKDGFNNRKNAEYPPDELFSELPVVFNRFGMDGFGDFLVVGDEYFERGGPAHAVAIHLTYFKEDEIWIRHFVSDRKVGPVDPGGKFLEALTHLIDFLQETELDFSFSSACDEFRDLYERKHYPGLGAVKELSMRHHIELIANSLD